METWLIGMVILMVIEGILCPIRDIVIALRFPKPKDNGEYPTKPPAR